MGDRAFHSGSADRGASGGDTGYPHRRSAGSAQGVGRGVRCGPQCLQPLYGIPDPRRGHGARRIRGPRVEEDYGKEYACVKDPENYFFLVVKGDSMEPRISDGDLALVHRQNTLDNGDLGVLVYGADGEGTLKKYIQRGNSVILHPFNPAYEELVIKGEELDHLYIAGKVVETKAKW